MGPRTHKGAGASPRIGTSLSAAYTLAENTATKYTARPHPRKFAGLRDEQTDRTRNLEHPCQIDDPEIIWQGSGDHRREIILHGAEVRDAGEQEHDHQGPSSSISPGRELFDPEPPNPP